jgi:hypothetical protein
MTRTAAADAVMSACRHAAAACPVAAGTAIAIAIAIAIAFTGPGPSARRPGRARPLFLRHPPGAPHRPELRHVRLHHRHPFPGNAASFAGWPADPGRDIS